MSRSWPVGSLVVFLAMATISLTGCQTSNPMTSLSSSVSKATSSVSESLTSASSSLSSGVASLNPFTKRQRDFLEYIETQQFGAARQLLDSEVSYFSEYFSENDKAPLMVLSDHIWNTQYSSRYDDVVSGLANCKPDVTDQWSTDNTNIRKSKALAGSISSEATFQLSKAADVYSSDLARQEKSCLDLYSNSASKEITRLSIQFVSGSIQAGSYVTTLTDGDFSANAAIQNQILKTTQANSSAQLKAKANRINSGWFSVATRQAVDKKFFLLLKEELVTDGNLSIGDAITFEKNKAGIFNSYPYGGPLLKVAYVDLDRTDRTNKTDVKFRVTAEQKFELPIADITARYGSLTSFEDYDFVLFKKTDQSDISREFRDKSTPTSKVQVGTKEVPNPRYAEVFNAYQTALQRQAQVEADNSLTSSCRGNQCISAGFLEGMAKNRARKRSAEAATLLGNTPQTLTEAVYQQYEYRLVDISSEKSASISIALLNNRDKEIFFDKQTFKTKSSFTVAYGVQENDPSRSSIISRHDDENDVTRWEGEGFSFKLSKSLNSIEGNKVPSQTFTNNQTALAIIETNFASVSAVDVPVASASKTGSVIADKRFNSVVLIETGSGLGTGFYIKPNIVLTAYHVVEGHSLVRLKHFNQKTGSGRLLSHDVRLDLALIETDLLGPPLSIHSGPLPLGATVEAIGHPQGLEFTITRGVISALRMQESIYTEGSQKVEFVQSDTPISPGNSGGPLFLDDVVIGVADFGNVKEFSQNLNFSVSFNEVREYLAKNNIR